MTVRTFVLDKGTIGNASFVAIPYNSGSSEGAIVVANFLMSPEAQARAQDPNILGYGTVLNGSIGLLILSIILFLALGKYPEALRSSG